MSGALRKVVIIDGARTPFLRSGTSFNNLMDYELLRHSLLALIKKTGISKDSINYMIAGKVIQEVKTYNVAREAVLTGGLDPRKTPCHTVTQACISSNQAITTGALQIMRGEYDTVVGGGVEVLSDIIIRYPRSARKLLIDLNFSKSNLERIGLILRLLRPKYFFNPDVEPTVEFTTGKSMGWHCERLNQEFGVTRLEQDQFAHRSHSLAEKAYNDGLLTDICPVTVDKIGQVSKDNGVRVAKPEALTKLKPVYDKSSKGSITAANASFLTDGASCTLLMAEEKALQMGLKPKAVIKDFTYASVNPKEGGLLLGPAHATAQLLTKNKVSIKDIDVFEFHEAFAGQLIANMKALDSDAYSTKRLGLNEKLGLIPMDKLNTWGGSVSIGHPFGATGSRLVNMASNRLVHSGNGLALVGSCAAGGLGHAILLEKYK